MEGGSKKRKLEEKAASSSFSFDQPEVVKAEWLEIPSDVQSLLDSKSVAWDKYSPYDDKKSLPFVPLDHPSPFSEQSINDEKELTRSSPALCFHVHALCGRARAGTLHFPKGPAVPTPRFMPVGTKGTLKGVLPEELGNSCPLLLANTYHLALQPGTELIDQVFGGLPKFMGNSNQRRFQLLTDSGGFQMVSLAALSQVTEEAVVFESPYKDKKLIKLRPEDSIRCQNEIGANIIMQLDDVISSTASDQERFRLATLRTLRWYDRCKTAHKKPHLQSLYPIAQGHLDTSPGGLREICLAGFQVRDKKERIPGFAIGGLAGGESKDDFWKVVDHACRHLPDDRPRYLMGVGYPLDLVVCTALGVDQYDCVYPTRTARFGVALVDSIGGTMKLKQHEFASQREMVIEEGCPCEACSRKISRARIHQLLKANNSLAVQLLTLHNVSYMMRLVARMRNAIVKQEFPDFVLGFLEAHSGSLGEVPSWVNDALAAAGIKVPGTKN